MPRSPGPPRGFAPAGGDAPFLETSSRRAPLRLAEQALREGRGVWVAGPPGSGRQAFLRRLGDRLLDSGFPAATVEGEPPPDGPLAALYRRMVDSDSPAGLLETAEAVYESLLDGLWRGGPAVLLLDPAWAGPEAWEELGILASLTFLGRPVAPLALCGEGPAPLPGMAEIFLEPYAEGERTDILRHRGLLGGGGEADRAVLAAAGGMRGIGEALVRAEDALARLAYRRAAGEPAEEPAGADAPLFSPEALSEVGNLLDAISGKRRM